MKTSFISLDYLVSDEFLSNYFTNRFEEIISFIFYDLSVSPAGHGHYKIKAIIKIDGQEITKSSLTNNIQLIDAFKMKADFTNGQYFYESWNDVLEHLFNELKIYDAIEQYLFWKV